MTIDNGPVICYLAPGNSLPPHADPDGRFAVAVNLVRNFGRSLRSTLAELRRPRLRPVRLSEPHGSLQNHWSALSAPSIPAIVPCACFGLPPHCDGSLGRHRRRGHGFVVVASRLGPQQREPDTLQCGQRGSVQRYQPCLRLIRALRPSICRAAFSGWEAKHEKIRKAKRSVSCFGLFRGCYPAVSLPAGSVPNAA